MTDSWIIVRFWTGFNSLNTWSWQLVFPQFSDGETASSWCWAFLDRFCS